MSRTINRKVRDAAPLFAALGDSTRLRIVGRLAGGAVLSIAALTAGTGVTRQAIDNRRKRGNLLAVQLGRRGYRYPAWQFTPDGVLPGLSQTLRALGDQSAWIQLSFLLNENAWLNGRRPLDLLRQGEIAPVIDAAAQYGEQSAA